jgi:hypothetical protein
MAKIEGRTCTKARGRKELGRWSKGEGMNMGSRECCKTEKPKVIASVGPGVGRLSWIGYFVFNL